MANTNPNLPKKAPWWRPAKYFEVRKAIPVEQRSYTKMYGILAILLFAFTVWAVLDEVMTRRPWKDIQADFKEFKAERLRLEIKKERAKIPGDVRKALKKRLADLDKQMNSDSYQQTLSDITDLESKLYKAQRDYTFAKATSDEVYYYLDEERTSHQDTTKRSKEYKDIEKEKAEKLVIVNNMLHQDTLLKAKILPIQKAFKEAQRVNDSVYANVIALQRKLEAVDNMPIAVKQTMLVNYEKTNFNNLKMRIDRCESCHLSYSDPLFKNDTLVSTDKGEIKAWLKANKYNDEEHYTIKHLGANKDTTVAVVSALFRLHPNVDLLIKTHRMGEPPAAGVLGCTSCHAGQGPSVVSTEFAHGFQEHWAEPLLTGHYVESSCQNCHSGKIDFESAKFISQGKKLFTDFGCYGCHSMPGYEELPGQAPSLLNVSKKVTPQWIYQWIKNPKGWGKAARMPNFMLSDDEATAITAFIVDQSKGSNYAPLAHYGGGGDAGRGKQTFFDAGCVACHTIDDYKGDANMRIKEGNLFGANLNKEGSKVTSEWLYDWLKNPKNYLAHSRMPSLRLSDEEAADLTAYIMPHTGVNDDAKSSLTKDISDASLIKTGENLVRSYGCFGCHEIKGMEKEAKVSVSLSTFGKKTPGELFYGNVDGETLGKFREKFEKEGLALAEIETSAIHENQDWYTWVIGKMKNARMYQTERIPSRMPNFAMSDQEAFALSIFLRSQTGAFVPYGYGDSKSDPIQQELDKGRMFVHWNNCVGCHKIESSGGYVAKYVNEAFAGDQNLAYFAPPFLGPEGDRVQEQWLHQFLSGPFKIRPLVKMRMPTYGFSDPEISTATNYFLSMHKRPLVMTSYDYPVNQSLVPTGKMLFDKLKCLSCHTMGGVGANPAKSPDLENVKRRLRPEWVTQWIAHPDAMMPGTPMTGFWWQGGKIGSVDSAAMGGDPMMQIKAVQEYIHSIGKDILPSPTPYAVINGSDKYIMPNGDYEAAMLRAAMPTANDMMTPPKMPQKQSEIMPKKKHKKLAMN
jgi:mono/diheme cytochrome c family protein